MVRIEKEIWQKFFEKMKNEKEVKYVVKFNPFKFHSEGRMKEKYSFYVLRV